MKPIHLAIGASVGLVLLLLIAGIVVLWFAVSHKRSPDLAKSGRLVVGTPAEVTAHIQEHAGSSRPLSEQEIDAVLRQIPRSGWDGARGAGMLLSGQDPDVLRERALRMLGTLEQLPVSDY